MIHAYQTSFKMVEALTGWKEGGDKGGEIEAGTQSRDKEWSLARKVNEGAPESSGAVPCECCCPLEPEQKDRYTLSGNSPLFSTKEKIRVG